MTPTISGLISFASALGWAGFGIFATFYGPIPTRPAEVLPLLALAAQIIMVMLYVCLTNFGIKTEQGFRKASRLFVCKITGFFSVAGMLAWQAYGIWAVFNVGINQYDEIFAQTALLISTLAISIYVFFTWRRLKIREIEDEPEPQWYKDAMADAYPAGEEDETHPAS